MKKLTMRFCQRNVEQEGSDSVLSHQRSVNGEILNVEVLKCLSLCHICTNGPICTINDNLFAAKNESSLNRRIDTILKEVKRQMKHNE